MDPLLPPAETEVMEAAKEERRRIQFSVPVPSCLATQLDAGQMDLIRRRRPTPATLFRLTDRPPSPEDSNAPQWLLGEKKNTVYQPPSLKEVQRMAQAHMKALGLGSSGSVEREDPSSGDEENEEESEGAMERRKLTLTLPTEGSRPVIGQSAFLPGSKVNSKANARHYSLLRPPRGDEEEEEVEEEEEEEEEEKVKVKGKTD